MIETHSQNRDHSNSVLTVDALVIGAGPAGLMACEELGRAGHNVLVADAMPSPARKFLMAGKSGLNLTKDEPFDAFLAKFSPLPEALHEALAGFGPQEMKAWSEGLGLPVFTGSTGRVFPKAMKASPLLRAWLARLNDYGVELRTRWNWTGFDGERARFETPSGPVLVNAKVIVLALGGASWARLGSTGMWSAYLPSKALAPFAAANAAAAADWSAHMQRHFGGAVKNVTLRCGPYRSQGEFVIVKNGLEGGGIYSVSRGLREGHALHIDLLPNLSEAQITAALMARKPKESVSNTLRKRLKLTPEKIALLQEVARPLPSDLAPILKNLEISDLQLRPMDEAISTAGGVRFDQLTSSLALKAQPNVYICGEMLDWEAPTGGYLLTACFATGRVAGRAASVAVQASRDE
jgi:uncharacterized flavoprotein (TIGR03862 family)